MGDAPDAGPDEAVEPWDWTGRTENLVLSSPDGLTVADAAPSEDGSLAATLSLEFALDPAVEGVDTAGHDAVVPGDTFAVDLPGGLSLAPDAVLDVFLLDEQGAPSSVRIGEAVAENDGAALRVTLSAPTDEEGSAAELPEVVSARLGLPVTVSAELLGDEPSELVWTLQADADDPSVTQTATLELPARTDPDDTGEEATSDLDQTVSAVEEDVAESVSTLAGSLPGALLAAGDESETSWSLADMTGSASMRFTWCDNNSGTRPAMSEYASMALPQFSLDGGQSWTMLINTQGVLMEGARQALHIPDGAQPDWVRAVSAASTGIGTWDVSISGLPTTLNRTVTTPQRDEDGDYVYDEHGQQQFDTETTPTTITWRLLDTHREAPEGYVWGENDGGEAGNQRYLMRTQTYTFTIVGKLGEQTLKGEFGEGFGSGEHADCFRLSATIDNQPVLDDEGNELYATLADILANPDQEVDVSFTDDNTAVITATLPMYDEQGAPIVYHMHFDDSQHQQQPGHDYFQPTYNNAASPSHGSATDNLYAGGTMTIRPVGTTSFDAEKVWLDGGDAESRPAATFTLWRYSTNGDPASAAQVQLNANEGGDAASNSIEYVTIEVPEGSTSDSIDLGALLDEKYGDGGLFPDALDSLPKYDPDGYPYIYALREDTSLTGYEIVLGSVDAEGRVDDTGPNYTDTEGARHESARGENDPFVYNGGVITNRLTGTVEVEATKTWQIAAFQDSLQNVEVTFTAQSRLAGTNDAWEDTDETTTAGGWRAESLTQTFSDTFSQYDSQGRELEYRWVETGVSVDGETVDFARTDEGGGSFSLTLTNTEGSPEELEFTSTLDEETDTITNTFQNVTDEHVEKLWEQPDGSLAPIKPQDGAYEVPDGFTLDTDGVATVELYQNGSLVGRFSMDGTVDAQPTRITSLGDKATYQETSSYHLDFENLPKYDRDGVRYTYLVLETGKEGWVSSRAYDPDQRLTTVTNVVAFGEGSEIRVVKNWVDGDDASHRLTTVVDLVARHDLTARTTIDPETGELLHYDAGEVVVSGIELSAENSWYAEVGLGVGGVDYDDVYVVERYLVDEGGTRYPVVSYDEAEGAYQGITDDLSWVNVGWREDSTTGTERVATPDHVYQSYATEIAVDEHFEDNLPSTDDDLYYNTDMRAAVATNRRIGLFDLTVEKDWNDGANHPDRPTVELTVSCDEYEDAFSVDGEGGIWVQVSQNRMPVTDDAGDQLTTADGRYRVEGGSLVITVDAGDGLSAETFHVFGLPKYDESGVVVHYGVEESYVGAQGDYVTETSEKVPYTVGARHFHDHQTIAFANTRQASRDVTFYKLWHDQYVNDELSQRPDIYLTLYRVTVSAGEDGRPTYSEPVQVDGYVRYLWTGVADAENPQYEQSCTIRGLPAYDDEGNEYVYYATETMSADYLSLDYADVRFDYASIGDSNAWVIGEDAGEPSCVVAPGRDAGDLSGDPEENGTGYALHEGGTFENSLTSNLVARGTKLWENVPGNVDQASADGDTMGDLPELTIYLQRRVAGEEWPSLTFAQDDSGAWQPTAEGMTVAWTSHFAEETTNQYSYVIAHHGENGADPEAAIDEGTQTALERYDEDGNVYQYRAIEIPWGLYDTPGGFGYEDVAGTDFAALQTDQAERLGVVVVEHGETGSFLINNVYDSGEEVGSLTVQKHFTGRDQGDAYPETTFDVYRLYYADDGSPSAASLVDSVTLTPEQLAGTEQLDGLVVTKGDGGANNTVAFTFSGLDIYAPNGQYWQYYVVEHSYDGGYTTTVDKGDLAAADVTGTGVDRDGVEGVSSPNLCDEAVSGEGVTSVAGTVLAKDKLSSDGTVEAPGDTTPDVTFVNAYDEGDADLRGTKAWDDYGDLLGIRPTEDEFFAGLSLEMIGNGGQAIDVTSRLQGDDPGRAFYYAITENQDGGTYSITIDNVERWAPDGTAWRYRLTEDLADMGVGADATATADDYYRVSIGPSSTVSADATNPMFNLRNSLKGQASVHKAWVDGDDPYGLRPTTVTVRLQARATYADGTYVTGGDAWTDARSLLMQLYGVTSEQLDDVGLDDAFFSRTLRDSNGWRQSWTSFPLAGMSRAEGHEGELFTIEYRAVETAIGDQRVEQPTADEPAQGAGSIYGDYHPYQPSQEDSGDAGSGYHSEITNTLETMSISASKTWAGDSSDAAQDIWNTRPDGQGNQWEATFLLQQRLEGTDDDEWHWLMEYGYDQAAIDEPLAEGIVTQTISGSGDSAEVTWENLPERDASGKAYEYRVVERVPGSYDVSSAGAAEVATATDATSGVTYRFWVVPSAGGNSGVDDQDFTNTLRTVGLTGTKRWDDHGTGIASGLTKEDMPTMTLYRAIVTATDADGKPTGFGDAQDVTSYAGQPAWDDADGDGVWTFAYAGLPAASEDNVDYVYWAEESAGTAEGYYPLYGSEDGGNARSQSAAGTTVERPATAAESGAQTNERITNVATRFTLNKVSDFTPEGASEPEDLRDIELTVYGAGNEGGAVYAVWRDAGGTASSTVWPEGTTSTATGGVEMAGENAGFIVGLPAGTYTVRETGEVPEGYAKAPDVTVTIASNGTVAAQGGVDVDVTGSNPGGTIEINVEDPVLRGHLRLAKYVSDDGTVGGANRAALAGAVFDLYRVSPGDGEDLLVASGLTTDQDGVITTVGNETAVSDAFKDAYPDGKYVTLANGLPEGDYYFLERDATPGAVMPSGDAAKSPTMTITQDTHYAFTRATADAEMANEDFSASVSIKKLDSSTGEPIEGAVFQVDYTAEGETTPGRLHDETTNAQGMLVLDDLEKGTYVVTELSNDGYVVDAQNPPTFRFTIDDADDDQSYAVTTADASDPTVRAIDFQMTAGTFDEGLGGIPNTPRRGSVTVAKTGAGGVALDGATFRLERMNGADWTIAAPTVVAEGLVTGRTYQMNDDNTQLVSAGGTAGTTGRITVGNLVWGTYRFVETSPAPGYVGTAATGAEIASDSLVIARDSLNPSLTGGRAVRNTPTSLELNKQSDVGEALNGAVFTVTPVDGSTFADGSTAAIELVTEDTGLATLTGQLVIGGTYEIFERQGPSGYDPVDATFRVTVAENGDLEVVGGDEALPVGWARADVYHDGVTDDQFSFIATNHHMDIELTKVSQDGNALDGVEFTLTGLCMDGNTTHVYTTGRVGSLEADDVRHGVAAIDAGLMGGVQYTLTETEQADGYVRLTEPLRFHMNDRGEIVVDNVDDEGNTPVGWSVGEDGISLTAVNDSVDLTITKRAPEGESGEPGEPLPGAVFRVTPVAGSTFADGGTEVQDLRTGTDGSCHRGAKLVVGGSYDITEVSAPEGYERVTGTMRVTVAEDGSINAVGSVDDSGDLIQGSGVPAGYEKVAGNAFEVQVTNEPIEVGIVKVGSDDVATGLPNARFEVTGVFAGAPGESTRSYVTDADGRTDIAAELVSGETYTLRETAAPAGYERIEGEIAFTVAEDGTVSVVGDAPAGLSVQGDRVTILAIDEPVEVLLDKRDLGDAPLAGATFTVSGTFVDRRTHDTAELEIPLVTTGGAALSLSRLSYGGATYGLVAGGTYTLTETAAPSGYETFAPFSFTVDEQGRVAADNGSAEAAAGTPGVVISEDDGTVTLTAHDRPIEVTLLKTDGAAPLADVAFELYRGPSADDGVSLGEVVTGENGTIALAGLVGGATYTLRETRAPLGYARVPDATFTVGPDGTVTLAGSPAGWSVANAADGTVTIVAVDERIGVGLTKVSTEGEALAGATFEVTGVFDGSADAETREVVVGERGATIEGLLAGETYELRETAAPEGYVPIAGSWSFTVAADGTLAPADGSATAAEGEAGYRVSDDGMGVVAADAPEQTLPGTGGPLSRTGDPTSGLLPVALGSAGLLLVAAGLHALRRRRSR